MTVSLSLVVRVSTFSIVTVLIKTFDIPFQVCSNVAAIGVYHVVKVVHWNLSARPGDQFQEALSRHLWPLLI